LALYNRINDIPGIDPNDFTANLLVGNVQHDAAAEARGGLFVGEAFYSPVVATATATTATATDVTTTVAQPTTPLPPVTTVTNAEAPATSPAVVTTPTTPTDMTSEAILTETTPPVMADEGKPGVDTVSDTKDAHSDDAQMAGDTTDQLDAAQTEGPDQPNADQTLDHGGKGEHHGYAIDNLLSGESFHFATVTMMGGEDHTVLVLGDIPEGAKVTDVHDVDLSDIGCALSSLLHALDHSANPGTEALTPPDGTTLMFGGFNGDGDVLTGDTGNAWFVLGPNNITVECGRQDGTDAIFGFHVGDVFRFTDIISLKEVRIEQIGEDAWVNIGGLGGMGTDHTAVAFKGMDLHDLHPSFDATGRFTITHIDDHVNQPVAASDLHLLG